jgi:hypothetical protein
MAVRWVPTFTKPLAQRRSSILLEADVRIPALADARWGVQHTETTTGATQIEFVYWQCDTALRCCKEGGGERSDPVI